MLVANRSRTDLPAVARLARRSIVCDLTSHPTMDANSTGDSEDRAKMVLAKTEPGCGSSISLSCSRRRAGWNLRVRDAAARYALAANVRSAVASMAGKAAMRSSMPSFFIL